MDERDIQIRIEKLRSEFGNLLDDEALRKLVMDELGLLVTNLRTISELNDREEASIVAEISRIYEIKEFKKPDGAIGKVRSVLVHDETGRCRLVLWDKDVELPDKMNWQEGVKLRLTNCYVKFSEYGIDVILGRKGRVEVLDSEGY
ncbi:MAG: hypothetical protein QW083_02340 [Methanomassiliicoccales archaeon]